MHEATAVMPTSSPARCSTATRSPRLAWLRPGFPGLGSNWSRREWLTRNRCDAAASDSFSSCALATIVRADYPSDRNATVNIDGPTARYR